MPIDAGAIGIRPVTQQRPTGGVDSVQRRDDGSSSGGGFRPQTNVALKTAIEDLSNALSKISSQEKFGINKLPQEVGDIVRNILQQSFSMEETLSQGIGSTIESQRFSMEQLTVFSRMLLQIGALADKGFSMQLSDETQLLLSKFKDLLVAQEGGNSLEPVLLSKAAFELIDSKTAEQLPQALYEILAQLAQVPTMQNNQPQQQSEGMQFLNKLIKFFMPRPSTSDKSTAKGETQQSRQEQTQHGQSQQQSARTGQPQQWQQAMRQSATQQFLQSMFRQLGGNKSGNVPQGQQPAQNNQTQNFSQQPAQNNQPQNFSNQPTQNNQPQNFSNQPAQNNQPQNFSNQPAQNNQAQNFSQQPAQNNQAQNFSNQPAQNNQPQNFSNQPAQTNQPQNFSNQPAQTNQPQNFSQQPAQNNQSQNFSQQPAQTNQAQNFSNQPAQNNQPQNFSQQPAQNNQ
ncbi:MAG: hypothetical protein IJU55_06380, partial [Selenomonadaceae bacterium]|nr:hypothetical protein [Selenomonadaceae bacterium]